MLRYMLLSLLLLLPNAVAQTPQPSAVPEAAQPTDNQFIYESEIEQGELWQLRATNLPANEDVIIVLTSPDTKVTILHPTATSLGNVTLEYPLSTAGLWRIDVNAAEQQQRLEVNVQANPTTASTTEVEEPEPATLELAQGVLQSRDSAGTVQWRLAFPADSGVSSHFLQQRETSYLAHGNSVLQIETETGTVVQRWLVPNQVLQLRSAGGGGILVSFRLENKEEFLLIEQNTLQQSLAFADNAQLFDWLRNEAKVADALTRVQQDTTNPWLYAQLAKQSQDKAEQLELWQQALDKASTFYTFNQLSQELYAAGFYDVAAESFDRGMRDFLARGYDPRLLTSLEYVQRYHFPYASLQKALATPTSPEIPDARRFWAERLWWSAPYLSEAKPLYQSYSQQLDRDGRQDQARVWASRAVRSEGVLEFKILSLQTWLWRLAGVNWIFVLAVLSALVLLSLVLSQKYQTIQMQQQGWALRFWHPFERITLWLGWLLIGVLVIILSYWQVSSALPDNLGTGRWSQEILAQYPQALPNTDDSSDVLAYATRYQVDAPSIVRFNDVQQAALEDASSWWQQVRSNPWNLLENLRPSGWSLWLWRAAYGAYALIVVILLISIFLPRPQGSSYSPRPWLFYPLALLIPGTALCSLLWGGILLSVWTVLGYEYLAQWLNNSEWVNLYLPTFGIVMQWVVWGLIGIYVLNALIVLLESSLHRRVRRKVTRPLLTGIPQKGKNLAGTQAVADNESRLPSGNYQVLRADEPQNWD